MLALHAPTWPVFRACMFATMSIEFALAMLAAWPERGTPIWYVSGSAFIWLSTQAARAIARRGGRDSPDRQLGISKDEKSCSHAVDMDASMSSGRGRWSCKRFVCLDCSPIWKGEAVGGDLCLDCGTPLCCDPDHKSSGRPCMFLRMVESLCGVDHAARDGDKMVEDGYRG